MSTEWSHQLRVYLTPERAELLRTHPDHPALQTLRDVLAKHGATAVSQFDAFSDYVRQAEREGPDRFPLYRWTKAVLDDPAKQAKHKQVFALRVGENEVYAKEDADALEADLLPLVGGELITRVSKHDTNPAKNLPVPQEYGPN